MSRRSPHRPPAAPVIPFLLTLLAASLHVPPAWAQGPEELRSRAFQVVEERSEELVRLSDAIWSYAELALREHRSAAELADYLEVNGFRVTQGVAGMPTAFVAEKGRGKPVIGILAEFDALPGLSNTTDPRKEAVEQGAPGHGCGHNLFGAASTGAAVTAAQVLEEEGLEGTIRLFGCPAEETVVGKVYMAREGVFDGLDACLDWHPSSRTRVDFSRTRAMNNFTVEFFGQTAHGAGDPWNGRSSLDAVELMNHAVNMLREHVKPSTRIHYVISDGGGAPNVVPAYAKVWYYVRDLERDGVESTYEWVLEAARGAAIATRTEHEVFLTTGVHSYLLNRPLTELVDRNLRAAGPPEWTEEEQAFARRIQEELGRPTAGLDEEIGEMPAEEKPAGGGSTDVAEVSRIVPTAKFRVASMPREAPGHSWAVVSCGGMSIGHKAVITAARTLSAAALELAVSPEVIEAAWEEFREKTEGEPYESPIPADQPPPLPPAGEDAGSGS
ncbi:MAG: amidohydrolase [bacterium]